jgi:hypothetical protein
MGMGGGFDPTAMAMMYQNMMKGMGNAPAINPNMAGGMMGQRGFTSIHSSRIYLPVQESTSC